MSIISHLLYDEQQSATYHREAEDIVSHICGVSFSEAEELGLGRAYRMALTEVLRRLTLYDLYHQPILPTLTSEERYCVAARGAEEVLLKNGCQQLKLTGVI